VRRGNGWGDRAQYSYWTALAVGQVDVPERRAMELLESVCDPYRFAIYCHTGDMPARGNLTGTIFLIRRRGRVGELEDGVEVASWCISIGPHFGVPGTDNVVVLKAMLEGEEAEFRRIGNRSPHGPWYHGPGKRPRSTENVTNPYTYQFIPKDHRHLHPTVRFDAPDPIELEREIQSLETVEAGVVELAIARSTLNYREALDSFQSSHRRRRSHMAYYGHGNAQGGLADYIQPAGDGIAQDLRERIAEEVQVELDRAEEQQPDPVWFGDQDFDDGDDNVGPDGQVWQEPWWDRQPGAVQYLQPAVPGGLFGNVDAPQAVMRRNPLDGQFYPL